MSRTPVYLTVPDPCHQAWEDMTPSKVGRHCSHCNRQVVDFTQMSDAMLLAYISKHGLGCGRFQEDQLNRMIVPPAAPQRKKFWPHLLLSIGVFLGLVKETAAQNKPSVTVTQAASAVPDTSVRLPLTDKDFISIHGVVADGKGSPLPAAQVTVVDYRGVTIGGAVTNFDGEYQCSFQPAAKRPLAVVVKWMSFSTSVQNIHYDGKPLQENVKLDTQQGQRLHTGIVIITGKSTRPPLIDPKEPTKQVRMMD